VLLNYQDMNIRRYFLKDGQMASEVIEVESHEPLKEEIRDFLDAVQNRREPLVTAQAGQKALEVALMITNKIKDAG
jgi:predicted dehydrogenase